MSLLVYSHASNALYYRLCKNDGRVLSIVLVRAVKRNLRSQRDSWFEACEGFDVIVLRLNRILRKLRSSVGSDVERTN